MGQRKTPLGNALKGVVCDSCLLLLLLSKRLGAGAQALFEDLGCDENQQLVLGVLHRLGAEQGAYKG